MEATKIIVDAVIDMESSNRIPPEQEEERRQYIDFIVSKTIPEGSFVEMWRKEETIRDLMVLTIENANPHHWESLRALFSDWHSSCWMVLLPQQNCPTKHRSGGK